MEVTYEELRNRGVFRDIDVQFTQAICRICKEDNELVQLRHMVNDSFRALWREGMGAYLKGDWPKARDIVYECLRRTNGDDGPSKNLVAAIDAEGGAAPRNWPGYRLET